MRCWLNRRIKVGLTAIGLAGVLVGLASWLPLLGALGQPMPGFIYSPFYTANIFNDASLNGYRAGLRPEDRVIQVNRQHIEQLTPLAAQSGELYLTYELKQALVSIPVQAQKWTVGRLLEKSGPLLGAGCWLIWLTIRLWLTPMSRNKHSLVASVFLAGLALLSAPDYFLAPGAGHESGFDPISHWHNGEYLATTAKWSSYFYGLLWTLAATALSIFWLQNLFDHTRVRPNVRQWAIATTLLLLGFDLGDYLFAALRTLRYNNPDYTVLHWRGEFWLLWPLVLTLAWVSKLKLNSRSVIQHFCLMFLVAGFMVPTIFDWQWVGPGVQWYVIFVVVYFELECYKYRANS